MDDDDLRRGRPTCHIAFGEATAILAGDALLTLAFEVLACHIQPAEIVGRCCGELARAAGALGMVGGQADDLDPSRTSVTLAGLDSIHRRKTGALITASVRLGALIASANEDDLRSLTEYGNNLGLAFQIVDDLLDATGDTKMLGKRTRKDAGRGKTTYPQVLGTEPSLSRARTMISDAMTALEPFGDRAVHLRDLAQFVLARQK
ncbi:MAG TPA: polyprenyl synthetase family protein, partial [Pirellulaceae bacterium]